LLAFQTLVLTPQLRIIAYPIGSGELMRMMKSSTKQPSWLGKDGQRASKPGVNSPHPARPNSSLHNLDAASEQTHQTSLIGIILWKFGPFFTDLRSRDTAERLLLSQGSRFDGLTHWTCSSWPRNMYDVMIDNVFVLAKHPFPCFLAEFWV